MPHLNIQVLVVAFTSLILSSFSQKWLQALGLYYSSYGELFSFHVQ